MPEEIVKGSGSYLPIKDYDIITDKEGNIKEVKNKQYGCVKYVARMIDQECGYVAGSKVTVFTTEYSKDMLNLMHIHINDTSDDVTCEVEYMVEGQSLKDFEDFKTDAAGRVLRFKIIVKEQRVFKMLYNQGNGIIEEIPFEEVRVSHGDIFILSPTIAGAQPGSHPVYAKIEHLPVSMMASQDKRKLNGVVEGRTSFHMNGFCGHRYFERLPGFIDISVLTSVESPAEGGHHLILLDSPVQMAVPICQLKPLDSF